MRGEEKSIVEKYFPGAIHTRQALYDIIYNGCKIELKRQQTVQWFDTGKYYNLSEEEKNIKMVFVLYDKKTLKEEVYSISLGNFLSLLVDKTLGWESKTIEQKYIWKKDFGDQSKTPLNVRKFISENIDHFERMF